jgi:cytochrome c oxidase subunit IV
MLVIAITISAIAAWYSVAGLAAIFAAAVIPVIIMGGALEAGKIVATVWLHNNWQRVSWAYKTYLIPAIVFLMLLTSMGIFGFLSKGHADQSIVSGDSMSKVAIYDEKIATERDNIAQAKRALEQMNAQVDQMMGRTDTDTGAQRAVNIRRAQAKERSALQAEITRSQKAIQKLQEERAPLAAEFRKVEAEVGPIKYIAALIYGDNPDQNLLEAAVRWVIILIVIVFDPLALCLILAANKQLEWARQGRGGWVHDEEEKPVPVATATEEPPIESPPRDDPVTDDRAAMNINPDPDGMTVRPFTDEEIAALDTYANTVPVHDQVESEQEFFARAQFAAQAADVLDEQQRAEQANAVIAEIPKPEPDLDIPVLENEEMWAQRVIDEQPREEAKYEPDDGALTAEQIQQVQASVEPPPSAEVPAPVDEFNTPIRRGADYAVRYKGKVYNLDAFNKLYPSMAIRADNDKLESASQCGFGERFPDNPMKGDMFIRTDYLPDRLFKWNGVKWIEVDKNSTDSYTYNQAYIQHLIQKLEAGEYEIEDLSDAEQAQVEQQIEQILKSKNG